MPALSTKIRVRQYIKLYTNGFVFSLVGYAHIGYLIPAAETTLPRNIPRVTLYIPLEIAFIPVCVFARDTFKFMCGVCI